MSIHLARELDTLKKRILALSAVVEESLALAVRAVHERNEKIAVGVIEDDIEIDEAEVDVEEECLKILALHQPVAIDLRYIVAVLKLNNDLERIGDLAVNIAERAVALSRMPPIAIPFDLKGMADKTRSMLKKSLDALVHLDGDLAIQVCAADDEVDGIHSGMYTAVKEAIRTRPDEVDAFIQLLSVSRHLERIADHATNIAEDVIYMIKGKIVRHHVES